MCVAFLAWKLPNQRDGDDMLLLSNRDEFYTRKAEPLHRWPDRPKINAGRDTAGHGGTWLGAGERGRFGFIVNVREINNEHGHLSRGRLVADYLDSHCAPYDYLESIAALGVARHKGFTIIVGDLDHAVVLTNRGPNAGAVTYLDPGTVHGFTNGIPGEAAWPKVSTGLSTFKRLAAQGTDAECFAFMSDETLHADPLPPTGYGAIEYALSARFIGNNPVYGTRAMSMLRRSVDGTTTLVEHPIASGGDADALLARIRATDLSRAAHE